MKNTIIYLILFFFCFLLPNCSHDKGCSDVAIDYGLADVYNVSQKMFDIYKEKKLLVLKNENGDTLNFGIKYSTIIRNDTVANTFKDGKLCTAEVYHVKIIQLDLVHENDTCIFFASVNSDFDYVKRGVNKKYDAIYTGWETGTGIELCCSRIYINDSSSNKIPHKIVVIHGKNVEVMDKSIEIPEQAFIHENKGIVAIVVPGKGTGLWVVDKIE